jgi:hypothetical protein
MKYIFILLIFISSIWAHKLNVFLTNEDSHVHVYSYFSSGAVCQNCNLIIKNNDKIVFEDKLDKNGKYTYTSKYKNIDVIVNATSGHIADEKIEVTKPHTESLTAHIKEQKKEEHYKIVISLFLIAIIFFIIKKVKRK